MLTEIKRTNAEQAAICRADLRFYLDEAMKAAEADRGCQAADWIEQAKVQADWLAELTEAKPGDVE